MGSDAKSHRSPEHLIWQFWGTTRRQSAICHNLILVEGYFKANYKWRISLLTTLLCQWELMEWSNRRQALMEMDNLWVTQWTKDWSWLLFVSQTIDCTHKQLQNTICCTLISMVLKPRYLEIKMQQWSASIGYLLQFLLIDMWDCIYYNYFLPMLWLDTVHVASCHSLFVLAQAMWGSVQKSGLE